MNTRDTNNNNRNPKIFFADLDGTLLNDEKKISPRTRRALEAFIDAGNYFAVSTGRAMESAMAVRDELELFYDRTFLIAYNGAQIYDCTNKKTVCRIGIDKPLVGEMFELAAAHRIHIHTYDDDNIICPPVMDENDRECLDFYRRVIKSPVVFTDDIPGILPFPPCKCIAIELHDAGKLENFRIGLKKIVGESVTLLYSNPWYLEIFRAEAGKGAGLKKLCDHLDISVNQAIAAGDEENDISMIEAAGLGIAMSNGNPRIFDTADAVTESDNNEDGLAPFLERAIA